MSDTGGINFSTYGGFGNVTSESTNKTLQSIDGTLKRIEIILCQLQSQSCTFYGQVLSQQKSEETAEKAGGECDKNIRN